jgi:hypothetical protein
VPVVLDRSLGRQTVRPRASVTVFAEAGPLQSAARDNGVPVEGPSLVSALRRSHARTYPGIGAMSWFGLIDAADRTPLLAASGVTTRWPKSPFDKSSRNTRGMCRR